MKQLPSKVCAELNRETHTGYSKLLCRHTCAVKAGISIGKLVNFMSKMALLNVKYRSSHRQEAEELATGLSIPLAKFHFMFRDENERICTRKQCSEDMHLSSCIVYAFPKSTAEELCVAAIH